MWQEIQILCTLISLDVYKNIQNCKANSLAFTRKNISLKSENLNLYSHYFCKGHMQQDSVLK